MCHVYFQTGDDFLVEMGIIPHHHHRIYLLLDMENNDVASHHRCVVLFDNVNVNVNINRVASPALIPPSPGGRHHTWNVGMAFGSAALPWQLPHPYGISTALLPMS